MKIEVNKAELIWDKVLILLFLIISLIIGIEIKVDVALIIINICAIVCRMNDLLRLIMGWNN